MSHMISIMDAYRRFARRYPLRFIWINIILVFVWAGVIMMFSGEDAEVSGSRSAQILVNIVNVVAPSADVTLENYESIEALQNLERVIRKLAHMTEYGILASLLWAVFFGFRELPRKFAYVIPILGVMIFGSFDEKKQTTVSGRFGSWTDVCIDMLGAAIAVFIIYRLTLCYRRAKSKNPSCRI